MIVQGRVQGVGFRYFCQREAQLLDLKGYAKNLMTGDVEIVAEGEQDKVDALKSAIQHNHPYAKVTNIIEKDIPFSENYTEFSIKF